MPRAPGGTFRASYDLDVGSHTASLLLISTDQKVSQRPSQIQGHEYWKAWFMVGRGGSKRHLWRLATTLAIGLWT